MSSPIRLLPPSKSDPIFAIGELAKAAGPQAINATVGMFMDEDGKPLMIRSTHRALGDIGRELDKRKFSYPPLLGLPEFRKAVTTLIFGNAPSPVASIATAGGTGAVSMNLRLAKLMHPAMSVILPVASWQNHRQLIDAIRMPCIEVPYLAEGQPSIDGIIDAVQKTKEPVTVLLHVSCHNPTGLDLSPSQWETLADVLRERDAVALLDIAYQGFANGIVEDAAPVRLFAERGVTTLVAWSASKNHALYSERVGLACAVAEDEAMQKELERHYMILTRGVHSAAATLGQAVVARVQEQYHGMWKEDVEQMQMTLKKKRLALAEGLPAHMKAAVQGNGMFALLPLTPEQVGRLRDEHKVFLTDDGRVNIAGIPMKRMEELVTAIRAVRP